MGNSYLEEAALDVNSMADMSELGLEGFSSFTEFLGWFKSVLTDKLFDNVSGLTHGGKTTRDISKVGKLIAPLPHKAIASVLVYQPVGFKDLMLPYASHLADLMDRLGDVEERLLLPLTKYLSMAVTNNDYSDVIWIDKNIKFVDADKEAKLLASFFNPKVKRNDTVDKVAFGEVYASPGDLVKTGAAILDGEKAAKAIDLKSLLKAESDLGEVIDLFVKSAKDNPEIITTSKQNIKLIGRVVGSIAKEVELLSVAMYSYVTLQTSYNDSVEKLIDNLK